MSAIDFHHFMFLLFDLELHYLCPVQIYDLSTVLIRVLFVSIFPGPNGYLNFWSLPPTKHNDSQDLVMQQYFKNMFLGQLYNIAKHDTILKYILELPENPNETTLERTYQVMSWNANWAIKFGGFLLVYHVI